MIRGWLNGGGGRERESYSAKSDAEPATLTFTEALRGFCGACRGGWRRTLVSSTPVCPPQTLRSANQQLPSGSHQQDRHLRAHAHEAGWYLQPFHPLYGCRPQTPPLKGSAPPTRWFALPRQNLPGTPFRNDFRITVFIKGYGDSKGTARVHVGCRVWRALLSSGIGSDSPQIGQHRDVH